MQIKLQNSKCSEDISDGPSFFLSTLASKITVCLVVDVKKLFWRKSIFAQTRKMFVLILPLQTYRNNAIFQTNYTLKPHIAFKMACFVVLLENLDFLAKIGHFKSN